MKFENSSDSATKSCCSTPLSQGTAAFSQNVPRDFKIMNDNELSLYLICNIHLLQEMAMVVKNNWNLFHSNEALKWM